MPFQWVISQKKYRDVETGRFVAQETVLGYVERIVTAGDSAADTLTDLHVDGTLSPADTINGLKGELKTSVMQEYMLGRGGRSQMSQRDWGAVGGLLSKQYALMPEFQRALEAGELSEAQIRQRMHQYFESAPEAYERGNAAAHSIFSLPAYPRDGSTECMNGCKCHWRIVDGELSGDADCYWEISPLAENCPTCLKRATLWYPIRYRGGILQPYTDVRKGIS